MKKIREWSSEEDQYLIQTYSEVDCFQRWKIIAKKMKEKGINKSQIECRDRYVNKLNPNLNHNRLTPQQIKTIFTLYNDFGSQWSEYEGIMQGRSQNMIKNKFYSTIRSCVRLIVLCFMGNSYCLERLPSLKLTSKSLMIIYEGKKEFKKFKGLVSKSLKIADYDIEPKKTDLLKEKLNVQLMRDFVDQLVELKWFKPQRIQGSEEKMKKDIIQTQKQKTKSQSCQGQDESKVVQSQVPNLQCPYVVTNSFYQSFVFSQLFNHPYNMQCVYNVMGHY